MKSSRKFTSLIWIAIGLVACGQAPVDRPATAASPDPDQLYETSGFVIETPHNDPQLCLGAVAESHPPQCQGIPMVGWQWDQVDGEEQAGGTRWGTFHVVGTYDGKTFTVHEATEPKTAEDPADTDPMKTPCAEPAEGWAVPDPSRASHENVVETQTQVSGEPDFAALWIDYYDEPPGGPTEEDPGKIILNVAFTGDLERHEQEVRELWGGPLCVVQHERTLKELEQIQSEFPAEEFGLRSTWSDIDVAKGKVIIGVVTVDEQTLQEVRERYGDAVQIEPSLRPVSR